MDVERIEAINLIQIAICDDEEYMINLLAEKILCFFKHEGTEVCICSFLNGESLLSCDKKYDIIFLDVQMSGRMVLKLQENYETEVLMVPSYL